MAIEKVTSFPFPTPPDRMTLSVAIKTLVNLGALTPQDHAITDLGRCMSEYPVGPRYAKMLLLAKPSGRRILELTIALVAALAGQAPFVRPSTVVHDEDTMEDPTTQEKDARQQWAMWYDPVSDLLAQLKAVEACTQVSDLATYCMDNCLHAKTMEHALKLREQLTRIANTMRIPDSS